MQRTNRILTDLRGGDRTLVWEPNEINMFGRVIAPAATITSEGFLVDGFRHFHVYVNRSALIAITVLVFPFRPEVRTGAAPLAAAAGVAIGAWGAGAGTSGVFYFGQELLLTDAVGRNFRFGPMMALQITNTGGANVTVDAWIHAQDG